MINSKLNDKIKKINDGKAYKIKCRKIKDQYSIFLEIRRKGIRETENLNLYLSGKATNLQSDKRTLEKAREEQNIYEEMIKLKGSQFVTSNKMLNANYIEYFRSITNKQSKNTKKAWSNTLSHLEKYTKGKTVTFKDVNEKFWNDFKNYLLKKVSNNSASCYFSKVKQSFNEVMREGLPLQNNPARYIRIKTTKSNRQFLTKSELELLINTPPPNKQVANAFIFSCFTGLRLSDIKNFTFDKIYNDRINVRQGKTKEFVEIKLPETAKKILEEQLLINDYDNGKVFNLLNDDRANAKIKKWIETAGIKKHITFHCARHTFACLLLATGSNIYTVSKLLGHTDIKHTLIYASLVDGVRDQAIDNLPEL